MKGGPLYANNFVMDFNYETTLFLVALYPRE